MRATKATKATRASAREIEILLDLVDEAFDRKAWHGPNLWGAVRRLPRRGRVRAPGSRPAERP